MASASPTVFMGGPGSALPVTTVDARNKTTGLQWIRRMLSDTSDVSFSRIASLLALLFALMWTTFYLKASGNFPSLEAFKGMSLFIGIPYTVGKFNETLQILFNRGTPA